MTIYLPRRETGLEAFSKLVKTVSDDIQQVKQIRTDREIRRGLYNIAQRNGTFEEMAQFLAERQQPPQYAPGPQGLLQSIFDRFDPNVAATLEASPIENLLTGQMIQQMDPQYQAQLAKTKAYTKYLGREKEQKIPYGMSKEDYAQYVQDKHRLEIEGKEAALEPKKQLVPGENFYMWVDPKTQQITPTKHRVKPEDLGWGDPEVAGELGPSQLRPGTISQTHRKTNQLRIIWEPPDVKETAGKLVTSVAGEGDLLPKGTVKQTDRDTGKVTILHRPSKEASWEEKYQYWQARYNAAAPRVDLAGRIPDTGDKIAQDRAAKELRKLEAQGDRALAKRPSEDKRTKQLGRLLAIRNKAAESDRKDLVKRTEKAIAKILKLLRPRQLSPEELERIKTKAAYELGKKWGYWR
jgi:hypothetical protein